MRRVLKPFTSVVTQCRNKYLVKYLRDWEIDVLVIDELEDNAALCRTIKRVFPAVKIVCLDYSRYGVKEIDGIINLFNHNRAVKRPQAVFHGKYLEGLAYALIRDEFERFYSRRRKAAADVKNILVTFGGSDPRGNTLKVLRLLKAVRFAGHADVILGPFFQGKSAVEQFIRRNHLNCRIHSDIRNIAGMMFKADIAFCGSGTTILELCSLGTPAFIAPQTQKESGFSKMFHGHGAACAINNFAKQRKDIVKIIADRPLREKMSRNARKLVDGKGKQRIADFLLKGL